MLRRSDENRAVTPGKAMRAVRVPPSRFPSRVSTPTCLLPTSIAHRIASSDVAPSAHETDPAHKRFREIVGLTRS